MTTAEGSNHAKRYLQKAREYLASAQDNLAIECATPAAGDAIHAGISAKDAIVTKLTVFHLGHRSRVWNGQGVRTRGDRLQEGEVVSEDRVVQGDLPVGGGPEAEVLVHPHHLGDGLALDASAS